jgi:hypothetical protein
MQRYFDKFPTIVYNGYTVKNIMARVKILDKVTEGPELFNNYQITNAVRADNLSYNIYGDQYFSWLVYLSNNIVDPYYDWNLSQYDFDQFIIEKYGSFAGAQGKVAYWNNNWYDNPAPITVGAYAILADYAKKYYEPVFGGKQIIEYKRRENDWIVNTNQIWEYTVNADLNLQLDEKVTISNSSGSAVANGQVLFANSTVVRIHQVFGTSNTQTGTITGSGNTANVSAATLIAKNISDEERVYWSEITYYDVEDIKNSAKQNIRLISPQFSMQTALELKRSFS